MSIHKPEQASAYRRLLTGDTAQPGITAAHWVARFTWSMGTIWERPRPAKAAKRGSAQLRV